MELKKNNTVRLPIVLASFLVGFYIDVKCVNWTLAYGFFSGREGGFMPLLYPSVVACVFMLYCFTNIKKECFFSTIPFFLSAFLVLFYSVTNIFIGPPLVSIAFFSLFTVVGLILPSLTIVDGRYLLISIMLWPSIAILKLDQVFRMELSWKNVISMDASYAFMVPVIATIVYLFTYYRRDYGWQKKIITVLALLNSIFFLKLFQYGSRGPLLAIFFTIVFFLLTNYSKSKMCAVIVKRRFIVAIIAFFVVFLLKDFFFAMILLVMEKIGIYSAAIEKVINLSALGNLSNGRNGIQILALEGFWNSALFGNGLDRFDANTGLAYPHNFVIQILYDGGLFLFCLLLIPIVLRTFLNYKRCSYDQYVVQSFLLFSSVPYASLSEDLWENAFFWLFVGALFSSSFVYSNNSCEMHAIRNA